MKTVYLSIQGEPAVLAELFCELSKQTQPVINNLVLDSVNDTARVDIEPGSVGCCNADDPVHVDLSRPDDGI